jgi:putative hydrolase of the HAD superfamily
MKGHHATSMAVQAITFDFWCTLFRDAEKDERQQLRVDAVHEATGAPHEAIHAALETVWREFSRHHLEEQRTLRPEDAVHLAAQELGVTLESAVRRHLAEVFATAIVHHSPVPIDGAFEAVRRAAKTMPIALVSDTGVSPGRSLKQLMDRHGFTPHFTALVFSDEVGVSKPQPRMFEAAARALGVETGNLLHIGDLEPTDIAGAHAVGAKAALFTGDNSTYGESTAADYVFTHWNDFIARLAEIV